MKKRTQKSQKRTKFLFILIILTAILSITATYAWFSTQRDVEISNLKVKVESAENLQISLDGESWAQSIEIEDMKQLYGTHSNSSTYQATEDEHSNYIPTELLPVSTTGALGTGAEGDAAKGILKFVKGDVDGVKISNITACSEADVVVGTATLTKEANNENHPYLVFDLYLRNLSRRTEETYSSEEKGQIVGGITATSDMVGKIVSGTLVTQDMVDDSTVIGGVNVTDEMVGTVKPSSYDELVLDAGSRVWIDGASGTAGTGLEYSTRIAFIPYGETADLTDDGETVRELAADGTEKVSIWEPNYNQHTDYVVNNNKRGINANTYNVKTYPVLATAVGQTIADMNSTTDPLLGDITTVQVANATSEQVIAGAKEGTATQASLVTPDGNDKLKLDPNQITKVRVYLWLEGQDPDCIDLASTGKELSATIRLVKPDNYDAAGGTSYAGGETST